MEFDIQNTAVLILLVISIFMWFLSLSTRCPPPRTIIRYVQKPLIDYQFSDRNLPSKLYKDMFEKDGGGMIWINN